MILQISSFDQLEKILIPIIKECLEEIGNKANEVLREHIDKDVYQAGRQTNYYAYGTSQPTFTLRDSITTSKVKTNGNLSEISIYHDKNKMDFDPDNFIHGSRYWKDGVTDIRDILPMIINDGLSGNLFGEGWWQNPRPYWSNALIELQQQGKIREWFIQALKKRGINAK